VQPQRLSRLDGDDRVGPALIVAELNKQGFLVQDFNDRSDLAARQMACWKVCLQGHNIMQRRLLAHDFHFLRIWHDNQGQLETAPHPPICLRRVTSDGKR
jgi:hypothetical protein